MRPAVLLGLTGCSLSLESVPMPSQVSGPSYELKAEFRNALNLPQGAPVKLRGNRVGTVQEIKAHDYIAQVTLRLRKDTPILQGTRAEVRTTAPMGEAYVELTPPADPSQAVMLPTVPGCRSRRRRRHPTSATCSWRCRRA